MLDFTMHPQLGAIAATFISTRIVHDIVEALLHLALFDSRLLDAYKLHPFAVESLLEERHPSARQLTPRTQTVRRITNDLTSRARLKCVDIRSGHLELMQRISGFHFASRFANAIPWKICCWLSAGLPLMNSKLPTPWSAMPAWLRGKAARGKEFMRQPPGLAPGRLGRQAPPGLAPPAGRLGAPQGSRTAWCHGESWLPGVCT